VPGSDPASLTPVIEAEDLRARGLEACLGVPAIVLEIGFGRADFLMALADGEPKRHFLGVEISRKRVEKAGRRVRRRELSNVHLIRAPAEYLLARVLPEASVEACWINCPDPWPKKRHHRRRLLNGEFLDRLGRVMLPGSALHISTDHQGYAEWIHDVLSKADGFYNLHAPQPWSSQSPKRPQTAYEAEWLAEGRTIVYFDYRWGAG
jgi:tRNA (guanine-N7-)-methyltransferase